MEFEEQHAEACSDVQHTSQSRGLGLGVAPEASEALPVAVPGAPTPMLGLATSVNLLSVSVSLVSSGRFARALTSSQRVRPV